MPTFYGPPSDGSIVPANLQAALAQDLADPASDLRGALDGANLTRGKSTALAPWHAALANRDNAPAKWWAFGDSITEGASSSAPSKRWVQRSLGLLRHRFPTEGLDGGGFGFVPPYYDGSTMGQPFSAVTTTGAKDASFGIGRRSVRIFNTNTYTYTITGTSFDVWYVQGPTTGGIVVTIDGGAARTITTTNATLADGVTWNSGPLTAGEHTVTIAGESSTQAFFCGLTVFNGDENKGIQLYEAGHYGYKTTDWVAGAGYWESTIATVQPQLVTIALMTNDYQAGIAPDTAQANLVDLIGRFRNKTTLDPAFVLIAYPARADVVAPAYPWSQYVNVAHEIAAADPGVTVLDLSETIPDATSTTLGLWNTDKVHPTNKGHAVIADRVTSFLEP